MAKFKVLENLRKKINKLDKEILELLKKRFKIAQKIGKIKKKFHLPLEDKIREKEILKKKEKFKIIFKEIIKACKKVQKKPR